jgi:hypothetical protein
MNMWIEGLVGSLLVVLIQLDKCQQGWDAMWHSMIGGVYWIVVSITKGNSNHFDNRRDARAIESI